MDKKINIKKEKIGKLILVTGGQRSGKSEFAENLALQLSSCPVYLATARIFDEEMRKRVRLHQKRRENIWENLEEPLYASNANVNSDDVVLLDCLTLLSTNWFFEDDENIEAALSDIQNQLEGLFSKGSTIIIVTNEIGMGGVSDNELQRKFTDLQGWINQYVANRADDVYMLVSGIPVKIK